MGAASAVKHRFFSPFSGTSFGYAKEPELGEANNKKNRICWYRKMRHLNL